MENNRKAYRQRPLVGGFDFQHGHHEVSRTSASAPLEDREESDYQRAVFTFIRANEPRQPTRVRMVQRRKVKRVEPTLEPAYDTPEYETYTRHPLYVLTRLRHFPNGGHRHGAVAAQLKAEGVKKGALDLYLDASRRGYHGFRVELKAGNGELKPEQREEIAWLRAQGYFAHVAWHDAEAIAMLLWYLSIPFTDVCALPSKHFIKLPKKGGHDERCGCDFKLPWWW